MRLAVGEEGGVVDLAPARDDPAELPAAGDRRRDLAFARDMEYLPRFYSHDEKIHSPVEYSRMFHSMWDRRG